jgi:hypothetical protein
MSKFNQIHPSSGVCGAILALVPICLPPFCALGNALCSIGKGGESLILVLLVLLGLTYLTTFLSQLNLVQYALGQIH